MFKKKIIVTGGAGFVGTNLIIQLQKLGHDVVSIDNYSIGSVNNHVENVTYINGYIENIFKNKRNNLWEINTDYKYQESSKITEIGLIKN